MTSHVAIETRALAELVRLAVDTPGQRGLAQVEAILVGFDALTVAGFRGGEWFDRGHSSMMDQHRELRRLMR